ncbi:adenine nucleotide alpha-hydrolase family protein [Ensifer soli]|uniref:adenine nucleotide alpha hydrolase n=1 Tax=Ciceribacter sp. sgz301302 TaxID=3342379 RepID=UPI0035B78811
MTTMERLAGLLETIGPMAIAVSGGVDSMALAALAHRRLGPEKVLAVHAVSAAVPAAATARVETWATREGWTLRLIDAGEMADPAYRANPVDRCFFCKGHLYGAIARLTDRQVLSGANGDDLAEYRPGLAAARDHGVRHPYLEAGFDKAMVRALARDLGLDGLAELPASPCLSSRVETAIEIEPEMLLAIDAVERRLTEHLVARRLAPGTVRCRVRRNGIFIELDPASLDLVQGSGEREIAAAVAALLPPRLAARGIRFASYRNGSAFVGVPAG